MTDLEALKALVELAKKAGAHEWAVDGDDRSGMEWNNFIVQADRRHMTVCFMAHAEGDNSELEAAAEFIAAAKNAIPELESLLARLNAAEKIIRYAEERMSPSFMYCEAENYRIRFGINAWPKAPAAEVVKP